MKKKKRKKSKKGKKGGMVGGVEEEGYLLGVILSLVLNVSTAARYERVLGKFVENNFEKIERLVELHHDYYEKVFNLILNLIHLKKKI